MRRASFHLLTGTTDDALRAIVKCQFDASAGLNRLGIETLEWEKQHQHLPGLVRARLRRKMEPLIARFIVDDESGRTSVFSEYLEAGYSSVLEHVAFWFDGLECTVLTVDIDDEICRVACLHDSDVSYLVDRRHGEDSAVTADLSEFARLLGVPQRTLEDAVTRESNEVVCGALQLLCRLPLNGTAAGEYDTASEYEFRLG